MQAWRRQLSPGRCSSARAGGCATQWLPLNIGDPLKFRDTKRYDAKLKEAKIDAVLVLTSVNLHHQVAIDSLRAGKHVLVEKPFAVSVRAGQR